MIIRRVWAPLFIFMTLTCSLAVAQNEPLLGSESQAADLNNPFTFGLNPALGEMSLPQISAGFKALHLGFLENAGDLNTGALIYTTHKFGGGLSFDASYLSTPMWGLKKFRAGYGRRVFAGLSLGLSVGLDQRSFDLSDADLSQGSYYDPLLTGNLNRTVATTGLAAAYSLPLQGLTAGLVLENPHEPVISLGGHDESVYLPATWRGGLSWERELFMLNAGVVDRQWRTTFAASVRGNIYGKNSLLFSLESDQWLVGARMGIGDRAWLEYTYSQTSSELAELTSGSHAIVLSWRASGRTRPRINYDHQEVDDSPYRPNLTAVDENYFPEARQIDVASLEPTYGFFTVGAEADTALIRIKRLKRIFGAEVDMTKVRRLPLWRIGVMDSTWSDRITWDITEGMTEAYPENDLPRGNYSENYQAGMDSLTSSLKSPSGRDLVIAANADQLDRARYLARKVGADSLGQGRVTIKMLSPIVDESLRRQLMRPVGRDSIPAMEEIMLYQYPALAINILRLGDVASTQTWTLDILDSLDRPVRHYRGLGEPPAQVIWDWRDTYGELVDVDQYTYQLLWRDAGGGHHQTIAREILIARQVMQRTLEFGIEKKLLRDLEKRQPMLILDPGREGLSVGKNQKINDSKDKTQQGGIE